MKPVILSLARTTCLLHVALIIYWECTLLVFYRMLFMYLCGFPPPSFGIIKFLGLKSKLENVLGRIMVPPKDDHDLILGTCEYAILHGKRHFVDVKKLRILR